MNGGTGALVAALALVLAGCGAEPQETLQSGTVGGNASVGDLQVRNVFVYPPDGEPYDSGDTVLASFAVVNESGQPDALVSVASPSATDVTMLDTCGATTPATRVPVPAVPTDPPPSPAGQPPAVYALRIAVDETVRAGGNVRLEFTFERAGSVAVDAPVATPTENVPTPGSCPG